MPKPEAPMSSKWFVKNKVRHYKIDEFVNKVSKKLFPPFSRSDEALTYSYCDFFHAVIHDELIDRGASFGKIRDAYEKTISSLTELSREKEDLLAQRIADRLISDGEVTLLSLNPKFDSDKWHEDQKKIVYPGIVFIPPKSSFVYA